jgi:hypothetical protein
MALKPCYPSQVNPRRLTTKLEDQAIKKILRYADANYIKKGIGYHEMLDDMSKRFNFPRQWLQKALGADSAIRKSLNDAYINGRAKAYATNYAKLQAQNINAPRLPRGVQFAWDLERSIKTLWHGPVFPFTHMIDVAKMPTKMGKFWITEARAFATLGKRGTGFHREVMDAMVSHPNYAFWRRMGAVIDPNRGPIGILGKRGTSWASKAWDMMKPARLELMDQELFDANGNVKAKYADMHKTDFEEMAKNVASRWNHITGAVSPSESTFGQLSNFMFAPELTSAKWHDFANDHAKAMAMVSRGRNMTKGDKQFVGMVLRTDAERVAGHAAVLVMNQAFLNAGILNAPGQHTKQVLNLTNPLRADYLRPKAYGQVFNMRGMDEILQLVAKVASISLPQKYGGASDEQLKRYTGTPPWEPVPSNTEALKQTLINYGMSKLHPSAQLGLELGVTHEDYGKRPLPSAIGGTPYPDKYRQQRFPQYTGLEYTGQVLTPIFAAGALKEFYEGLREHGMSATDAAHLMRPMVTGLEEFIGLSVYSEDEKQIGKAP